ncbi:hypothetical protein AC629_43310, partial [Bradyrhizobium sp. NAS80.1]|uniref:LysR family transcriptional regulator n=1 Tax=Bradyrhizobium sp. NAS80.1 TaxID=1680159 RepID=UPI000966AD75
MALGSVTAAAAALRISQPAVSKMLLQAEEQLGFKLFIRDKKRLIPTTEAQVLYPETLSAFAAIDGVRRLASDLRAGRSGQLRIAVAPTLAHRMMPLAIQAFQVERPGVIVDLRGATAQEVTQLVVDHRIDFGLILGPVGDTRIEMRELQTVDMGCVLPRNHPLCVRQELTAQDLAEEALIAVARHLPAGEKLARAFEDANVPLRLAAEVSQSSIACALVHA